MAAPVTHDTFGVNGSNTNPIVMASVSTVQTDYILVLAIYNEHAGTPAATVTSVTGAGVTWALRKRSNSTATGGLELWWGHGTGTLPGVSVTMNFSGAYDCASAVLVVVTGCANPAAPFDVNASLPAAQSAATAVWTPSFTGISTSSTDDLLLFCTSGIIGGGTPAAGFAQVVFQTNGAGAWGSRVFMDKQAVTVLQSAATFTNGASLSNPYSGATAVEAIFDAMAGNAPTGGGGGGGVQARAMVLA